MHGKPEEDKGPPKDVEDTAFKGKIGIYETV